MTRARHYVVAAGAVLIAAVPSWAQGVDKSRYSVFNPTPRELWRPLSADRPDITESPVTVDAGAIQLEASFFEYTHDSANDDAETTDSLALAFSNIKIGLLNNVDLQVLFAPYVREESRPDAAGRTTVADGPSDVTVRLKVNFWGNDGGRTALGVLPFVKIPTGSQVSNDHVEGGVALPFAWEITEGASLGVMLELDVLYSEETGDHDFGFLHTVVLGVDLLGPVGGYVEYVGNALFDGSDYEALASFGLTYELTENAVLDAGALIGLTRAATDVAVFTGITLRF